MWVCEKCNRKFKNTNQHHICTTQDTGVLSLNKPDELVLAFDTLLQLVMEWQPNDVGPSTKSIVFTNKKAWLIVKPMSKQLDLKFYLKEKLVSPYIHKYTKYPNKMAHHIRVGDESQITAPVVALLRQGFDYAMEG